MPLFKTTFALLFVLITALFSVAQNQTKRNDRPQEQSTPQPRREENKKPADPTRYSYEFSQPQFVVSHIVVEHDTLGRGKITFQRKGEETPIVEPVELSVAALGRMLFTQYAFPFEVTSVLILVAMVGAVMLARRERF